MFKSIRLARENRTCLWPSDFIWIHIPIYTVGFVRCGESDLKNHKWVRSVLIKIKITTQQQYKLFCSSFNALNCSHSKTSRIQCTYMIIPYLKRKRMEWSASIKQTLVWGERKKSEHTVLHVETHTIVCLPPQKKIKLNRNMASILWMGHHTKVALTGLAFVRFSKYKGFVLQCHSLILWLNNIVIHICSF